MLDCAILVGGEAGDDIFFSFPLFEDVLVSRMRGVYIYKMAMQSAPATL